MESLDIIIVNWNSGHYLERCLQGIARTETRFHVLERVVIVDNASTDGSVDRLGVADLPLVILRNGENRGFAAACNQGAAGSSADYLLFLNPDAVPESTALDVTVRHMAQHPDIGILGAQMVDDQGKVLRRSAARPVHLTNFLATLTGLHKVAPSLFSGIVDETWDHKDSRDVAHVMGAYLAIRRDLFESLGGFDEGFFVYYEDLDLCERARRSGRRVVYLADARAVHTGWVSSSQVPAERLFYSLRSRLYFCRKHFGVRGAAVYGTGLFTVELLIRLASSVWRRENVSNTIWAYSLLARALVRREAPIAR